MKQVFSVFLLSMYCLVSEGQAIPADPLKEGDTVPDLQFTILRGDSTFPARLHDYKGKLIILDFWGIHCAPCIESMPHMLALQEEFKDRIQIFLVTQDPKEAILGLWHKLKGQITDKMLAAGAKLAFINSDSVLYKMFPTTTWGTHVWIDKNMIFKAFAYDNSATADNINSFINGNQIKWATYFKPTLSTTEAKDWMTKRIGFTDHLLTYSFVTKYDERTLAAGSFNTVFQIDSNSNKKIGINCFNQTALELYMMAYFGNQNMRKNHVLLEVKDMSKFFPTDNIDKMYDWQHGNRYCYALKILPNQLEDIYSKMKVDMDEFFQFKSNMENRKVKCIVLKRVSDKDKIRTKAKDDRYETASYFDTRKLIIHNQPIVFLEQEIYNNYIGYKMPLTPFFNETGYRNNIDIELPWGGYGKDFSISELRNELQKYDLDLVEEYKDINVLVIRDTNFGSETVAHSKPFIGTRN